MDCIGEAVGVLERNGIAGAEGFAVVDEAVIVGKAAKNEGINQAGGAVPAAGDVDVGDAAAVAHTDVADIDEVGGDPVGERRRWTLIYDDAVLGAIHSADNPDPVRQHRPSIVAAAVVLCLNKQLQLMYVYER